MWPRGGGVFGVGGSRISNIHRWTGWFRARRWRGAVVLGTGGCLKEALALLRVLAPREVEGIAAFDTAADAPPTARVQGIMVYSLSERADLLMNALHPSGRVVIVAVHSDRVQWLLRELGLRLGTRDRVMDLVNLYEWVLGRVPLRHVGREWTGRTNARIESLYGRRIKGILDRMLAAIGLVVLVPLGALIGVWIKLDSKGAVFYVQVCVGRNGVRFEQLKFRTMRADAEAVTGPVWSQPGDPRITRAGRWLRRFRLDELPQLWNVLRGDMSLVGPRPERPFFVQRLSREIPHFEDRLRVLPGITGWAQVRFPYTYDLRGGRRKLEYDLYYIAHRTAWLDFKILLWTVVTILLGDERRVWGDWRAEAFNGLLDEVSGSWPG